MLTLWAIRLFISALAFHFFGFFCPCFASIKAILSSDIDAIEEYLTYWSVLGIISYLETVIYFGSSAHEMYPPEFKVMFILWLTLPRFQGAYRIYILIIKPYFESNEKEIDDLIGSSLNTMKGKLASTVQRVLYQLVIESNQSLLTSLLPSAATKETDTSISGSVVSVIGKTIAQNSNNPLVSGVLASSLSYLATADEKNGNMKTPPSSSVQRRRSSGTGSNRKHHPHKPINIVLEFCHLLQEGVTVYVPPYPFDITTEDSNRNNSKCKLESMREKIDGVVAKYDQYEQASLCLNHNKNQLRIKLSMMINGRERSLPVKVDGQVLADKVILSLWNVFQIYMDTIDDDANDSDDDNSRSDDDSVNSNNKGRSMLVIETIQPVTLVRTENRRGGASNELVRSGEEDCGIHNLYILGSKLSNTTNTNDKGSGENDVENELLESITYGLPLLIQQLKHKMKQKWVKVDKICFSHMKNKVKKANDFDDDVAAWRQAIFNQRVRRSQRFQQHTLEEQKALMQEELMEAEDMLLLPEEKQLHTREHTTWEDEVGVLVSADDKGSRSTAKEAGLLDEKMTPANDVGEKGPINNDGSGDSAKMPPKLLVVVKEKFDVWKGLCA